MVYKWKFNLPVSAQKAGERLEALEAEHGELTPEIVLEDSRDKNAVLHKCFEWDDTKAAEKYRLTQAGNIIRNITVVVEKDETSDNKPKIIRAFVDVSEGQKGEFINVSTAMNDKAMRARVLKTALAELESFRRKYENLSEFKPIIDEITQIKRSVEMKIKKAA